MTFGLTMYSRIILFAVAIGVPPALPAGQQPEIAIWPGAAPGSESWTQKEVEYRDPSGKRMIRNVVRPTLTAFLPNRETATGTAMIVCPGGGFRFHSWENEGTTVAQWLSDHGVAAFVLNYRLVNTGATEAEFQKSLTKLYANISKASKGENPIGDEESRKIIAMAAEDGRQAVRLVRKRASDWGVSPDRIGILGFSAGGIVTDEVALHHDSESLPNFAAPIYGAPFGEFTVPTDAPPLFILCADDDFLAVRASARLYSAWKAAGKSAELHIYSKGGHGFGMANRGLPVDRWIERLGDWLGAQGLLKLGKLAAKRANR
jgi:acetyl esterase/lipase